MRELTIRNADTYVWFALVSSSPFSILLCPSPSCSLFLSMYCTNTTHKDIAFQEICDKHDFKEPVNEKDDDDAADGDEPDSDPDEDDKFSATCDCDESRCSNDSRPCCANNSCGPW
jgi:hypothetical protein